MTTGEHPNPRPHRSPDRDRHAELPWWKRTTVYHIYPRSFADSNADGIGDLPGVISRLDYLRALGVETLWLSPFYDSPQHDFGYDISDHFGVAEEYGTLTDCRRLIREVHAHGMRLVMDMVLNHTSIHHPWFEESRRSRDNPRRDFYIWRDGRGKKGELPPNNWRSMLGGSGWHRDQATGQWYWASFLPFQPDLNYRNPAVKQEMLDVVRYWLREGADGLRLDIFNALYKDPSFADNPFSLRPIPSEDNPDGFFQQTRNTINHPDTIAFARELRAVADEFTDPPRFLVGEVFGDTPVLRKYCGEKAEGLHMVFLFKAMRTRFRAPDFRALIHEIEHAFADPLWPTYVFSNHDRPRSFHRLGEHPGRAKLLATLQLTVRGVPFIYYGEEIGMRHTPIPLHAGLDPVAKRYKFVPGWLARLLAKGGILLNRDECRLPMQWDAGPNAGFSAGERTWLPVHGTSKEHNVAAQEADPDSLLSCYRRLLALRREHPALHSGKLELLGPELPEEVLGYRRTLPGTPPGDSVEVLLNFSPRRVSVRLDVIGHGRRRPVRVLYSSKAGWTERPGRTYELCAYEGIVLATERPAPRGHRAHHEAHHEHPHGRRAR